MHQGLMAGEAFPPIALDTKDGTRIDLSAPGWRAVFVLRGAHCSICRKYLGEIEQRREAFNEMGIEVVAISADPIDTAIGFANEAGFNGLVAGGLSVRDMEALHLWMTGPDLSKLGYVHAEPGFFLIDPEGNLATAEVTTLPAIRPDLEQLQIGLSYITENNIRPPFGRYEAEQ